MDIKARDESGRRFLIEMQMCAFKHYESRILFYWANVYQEQLRSGDAYGELRPAISVSFLNHRLYPDSTRFYLQFQLLEKTEHFLMTPDIEFHVIELPKFLKTAEELVTPLDIWLYFFRYAGTMTWETIPAALRRPIVLKAFMELEMLTQNPREKELYEGRRKAQLDYNTGVKYALEEGMEQARREKTIEMIRFCEQLLNQELIPTETLSQLSLDELNLMVTALKNQVPLVAH